MSPIQASPLSSQGEETEQRKLLIMGLPAVSAPLGVLFQLCDAECELWCLKALGSNISSTYKV